MTDKVQKIREDVEKRYEYWKEKESNSHSIESEIRMSECQHLLLMLDSLQEEPVSVWHDPDEEPEVERTIIWEDEKMMGKHLFQGQWRPKIDVFGRKERWCYLSDILNL